MPKSIGRRGLRRSPIADPKLPENNPDMPRAALPVERGLPVKGTTSNPADTRAERDNVEKGTAAGPGRLQGEHKLDLRRG